jgi:hypothetical protein
MKKPLDTQGRIRPLVYLFWKEQLIKQLTLAEIRTAIEEDPDLAKDVDLQEYMVRKNAEAGKRSVVNQYSNKKVSTELKGRDLYLYLENLMFNNNRI